MIVRIGDNILSSLGLTTEENYRAVKSGQSGLHLYESAMGMREPFVASMINREELDDCFAAVCPDSDKFTPLEKAAVLSVKQANKEAGIDLSSPRVRFLFSSTKGNIDLLDENEEKYSREHIYLWYSARLIARYFKNPNTPTVVSNACISGAAAQIAAMRELESETGDFAVVIGVDFLSKFIISGFRSFNALSPEVCRPFDSERAGLNLGEAAAVIIYKRAETGSDTMRLFRGAIRNDANHISGPSRTGEGSFLALQQVLQEINPDEIAFINAHGTATAYNDSMEATAINRSGLNRVPVNSLKGYFGHTLGAAGVLESIISMHALSEQIVLSTHGFKNKEKDPSLNVTDKIIAADKPYCLKMLSGFGGCNAVLLFAGNQKRNATIH